MSYRAGFGTGFTETGKKMLLLYGIIYLAELLCQHWLGVPMVKALTLHPAQSPDFKVWQLVTHPFVHNPHEPVGFLLNCLVLYFFMAPVEYTIGTSRFLALFFISAAGGALCGFALSGMPGFDLPFSGMMPSLLALIITFGLLNPEATILLMFVLPVKAKYLSYGTVLLTLLTFLARVNPAGAYHLGGILMGYLYFRGPGDILNHARLKYLQWQHRRKLSKFHVIQGGREKKNHNDKPTIH